MKRFVEGIGWRYLGDQQGDVQDHSRDYAGGAVTVPVPAWHIDGTLRELGRNIGEVLSLEALAGGPNALRTE